jgi:integrase
MSRKNTGVQVRHRRGCPAGVDRDATCKCTPSYRAEVYDQRTGRKIRKTFPTIGAAKAWRADALGLVRRGQLRAVAPTTLRAAAEEWLSGARDGTIRARGGSSFKPSTVRSYEAALEARLLPAFGHRKLSDVSRVDLQDFADRLLAEGLDPSTIRNALMPLRAIYRRALGRALVAVNPTSGLELPALQGRRDRIADPPEAALLLAALPEGDRALWATATYAGLRRGELMALRWEDVDFSAGLIRVERSYDPKAGEYVAPKSHAGTRRVPIPAVLREHLIAHRLRAGRSEGLAFGRTATSPFDDDQIRGRAARAWRDAGLAPLGMHEARHTFASLMIAAGVNAKALSTYMGHASVTITYDRYGHLMPGNEAEAAGLLDAYLEPAGSSS